MNNFKITKGYDIKLAGQPLSKVVDERTTSTVTVYPLEFRGFRQRLKVNEGDVVKCGTELLENKLNEKFKIRASGGGTVKKIVRGKRRFVEKIVIAIAEKEEKERFNGYSMKELSFLSRDEILDQLLNTGYISLISQRPFSITADHGIKPKCIFVNGMNTGPFQADANVVAQDDPEAFQAGLNILTNLTDGNVHLCVARDAGNVLSSAKNVSLHTFSGPHPSGNTSVHISHIAPMRPTDVIWTIKAVDLLLIGRLFLDGVLPTSRIVSLGGPGIKTEGCGHYRLRIGGELEPLLSKYLKEGKQRLINGDILSGTAIEGDASLRFQQSSITVIPESVERRFIGWTMPGFNLLSFTRLVASTWMPLSKTWELNTSRNGDVRAMVLTGHYDKVMPMNIMVDFLIRAVLAGDTDEAIKLGILETAPEDFALCDFVCPSKLEVQDIIRRGLELIKEEGI